MLRDRALTLILEPVIRQWGSLATLVALIMIRVFLQAYQPFAMRMLVDSGIVGANTAAFVSASAHLGAMSVLASLVGYYNQKLSGLFTEACVTDLRTSMISQLMGLDVESCAHWGAGDLINRCMTDPAAVLSGIISLLVGSAINLVSVIAFSLVLVKMEPLLLLIQLPFLLAYLIISLRSRSVVIPLTRSKKIKADQVLTTIQDVVRLHKQARCYGCDGVMVGGSKSAFKAYQESANIEVKVRALYSAMQSFLVATMGVTLLIFGGMRVLGGQLTIGSLMAYVSYSNRLRDPLLSLAQTPMSWTAVQVSLERVRHLVGIMDTRPVVSLHQLDISIDGAEYGLDEERPLIRIKDLHIPFGSKVAIIGQSGAGKSLLMELLAGLLRPSRGHVLYDEYSLACFNLSGCVAVSPQRSFFNEQLLDFCRSLQLDIGIDVSDILSRPASSLSVGECKRLSTAITLSSDKPVMCFDEPTSGLSPDMGYEVMTSLLSARQATVIVVTHDYSLIDRFDAVVYVENGYARQLERSERVCSI